MLPGNEACIYRGNFLQRRGGLIFEGGLILEIRALLITVLSILGPGTSFFFKQLHVGRGVYV